MTRLAADHITLITASKPLEDLARAARKRHGQRFQAVQDQPGPPAQGLRRDGEPQVRNPAQQAVDGDLSLEPGQRRAQAEMHALAERHVPVRLAREVQCIRVIELPLIPVGGCEHGKHHLTARNRHAGDRHVLARVSFRRRFQRAVVTQELFDGRLDQRGLVSQPIHLLRDAPSRPASRCRSG